MGLSTRKEIMKEIRRSQVDREYHKKQMEYYEEEIKILNFALKDLDKELMD